ncbi:hypothetical protein Tco_1576493 [Tanacetum coccineum]
MEKESYHKLFDILKQYQKEVNEIHAEKIAKNANPLALNGKNVDTAPRYVNENQIGQFGNQRIVTIARLERLTGSTLKFHGKDSGGLTYRTGSVAEPLKKVQYGVEDNVFANERQHYEQPESIKDTHVVKKDDINVILDSSNMYRTIEKDTLERKLNETLGLLAQKEHDIKKGLKIKAYEVSVVKEKHDELVKQSLLTKSSYEGLVKEKNKIVTTSRYVVPTGRVKVPAGRYVVPTGKDNVIVSAGRSKVIPAGRTILVLIRDYVKSKDLDLWHVIICGDFPPTQNNPETNKDEFVPFDKQSDDLKKRLAKNNEAKMVIYNALPRREYERIFMCKIAKEIWDTLLITHQDNSQLKDKK